MGEDEDLILSNTKRESVWMTVYNGISCLDTGDDDGALVVLVQAKEKDVVG